jgi:hypothetical protein
MGKDYGLATGVELVRLHKSLGGLPADRVHGPAGPIPTAGEISALKVGDFAQVCFPAPEMKGEEGWLRITKRDGERFVGVVDKDLLVAPVKKGEVVEFEAKHVAGLL